MIDFLFAAGQFLCFGGLLYGLVLTIVHRDCTDSLGAPYDPLLGHDWLKIEAVPHQARIAEPQPLPEANVR
jgi:hypothetical protein